MVYYLDLADYLAIVTEVTGLDVETAIQATNLDLADSAFHAPQAGWRPLESGMPRWWADAGFLVTPSSSSLSTQLLTQTSSGSSS